MESVWEILLKFYGLDWIGMSMSLYGTYLITKRDRIGFVYCIMGCIAGGAVSYLTNVPSYVVSNMIFFAMNIKGYIDWRTEERKISRPSSTFTDERSYNAV